MKNLKRTLTAAAPAALAALFLLSACGSTPAQDPASSSSSSSTSSLSLSASTYSVSEGGEVQFTASGGSGSYTYTVVSGGGSINPSGLYQAPESSATVEVEATDSAGDTAYQFVAVSSGSSDTGTGLPAVTASFTVTGSSGSKPTWSLSVDTDNLLVVEVTAGAGAPVSGTNFTAEYGCVIYQVQVGSDSQQTGILSPSGTSDYNCPGASTNSTLNFSSEMVPGHGATTITVSAIADDFYCLECETDPYAFGSYLYGDGSCQQYCGPDLYGVYPTQEVSGTLNVQVNGTSL